MTEVHGIYDLVRYTRGKQRWSNFDQYGWRITCTCGWSLRHNGPKTEAVQLHKIHSEKEGKLTEPTNLKKLRGELAANEADRESARFSPTFMYELRKERDCQIGQWGDEHDRQHSFYDWIVFTTKFVGRAAIAAMNGDRLGFEREMVKVAAVAAAACRAVYPPDLVDEVAAAAREHARRAAERAA